MLLCNQHHTLKRLVLKISIMVGVVGIFPEVHSGAINEASHQLSDSGIYSVYLVSIRGFMDDFVLFVKYCPASMDSGNRGTLLQLLAATLLGFVDGISAFVAEKTQTKKSISTLLPVSYPIKLSAF